MKCMDREQETFVSRRMLFSASAAAVAGSALTSILGRAIKGSDSPLFSLVQECRQEEARYESLGMELEEAEEQLWLIRADGNVSAEARGFLLAARTVASESVARLHELEDRIARTRATTPAGMLLKACMITEDTAFEGAESQLEKALEERFSMGHFRGLRLMLDVMNMDGSEA